ncbi:glycosyl transferase family 1 [Embleya scabrispora]|uniref:D-inositol 3-phosphate glycosyltransferase n=1 Tax=Embleya scabrispora TaxID=159449 RepID=A0A1T3P4L9_9ACTN|nr:glycosyltransferase [Embleya scabrispora]OPC84048.1 glycosyl transferase family 1 [Embleya scabrispora]
MTGPLRVGLIASARHPIREPFAGGLEAQTWTLARALVARGHRVTLFAGPGSDPELNTLTLPVHEMRLSEQARADVSMPHRDSLREHHAYLRLMLTLGRENRFDVVHNNSLHYLPVAMAPAVEVPVLTTLHTPPTPWLESAIQTCEPCPVTFTAVSEHTARAWRHVVPHARVVRNGVDTALWRAGPGGGVAVWTGRLVPEKGPHLAIAAARAAGCGLRLAGPVADHTYFTERIEPLLRGDIEYVGHLPCAELVALVGESSVALVTPCWDEPYGLVVAEALACGTPVCAFDRGGVGEIVTPDCGRLVPSGRIDALAEAIAEAKALDRSAARARAEAFCSVETMVADYVELYRELAR